MVHSPSLFSFSSSFSAPAKPSGRGGTGGILDAFFSPETRPVELEVEKVEGVEPDRSLLFEERGLSNPLSLSPILFVEPATVFDRSTPLSRLRGPSAVLSGR